MPKYNNFTTVNIREYLNTQDDADIGENMLHQILSDFSCPANTDVERFLKEQSIEFTRKNQSVTYLVISNEDAELLGYFTLAVKPITVSTHDFSNTLKKKISRVAEWDEESHTYSLSAYLIAQLGKNYANALNKRITGKQLLDLAIDQIKDLQYLTGGMIAFLEAEKKEKLMKFYKEENGFRQFSVREATNRKNESHTLIQMLRVL